MDKNQQFEQQIKRQYDNQSLDQGTKNALRQAAISAIDQSSRSRMGYWFPTTAIAGLLTVITLAWVLKPAQNLPLVQVDDLVIINSEDALEMYQELEFFIWLDNEKNV